MNIKSILPKLALLSTAIIWGTSMVVVKGAINAVSPSMVVALRCSIGCLILAIIFHKKVRNISKPDFISGAIIGGFLFFAYFSQTSSVTYIMPGMCTFLAASYVILVPFMFWLLDGIKPNAYNVIASVLCLIGILFTSLDESVSDSFFTFGFGESIALLSGLLFALHVVAITKWSTKQRRDPIIITIVQFFVAAMLGWAVTIFQDNSGFALEQDFVLQILYLGAVCSSLGIVLQNIGLKYCNPSAAAIILSTEIIFSIPLAIIFFNEVFTVNIVIGFCLIFIAIIVSETKLFFLIKHNTADTSLQTVDSRQ